MPTLLESLTLFTAPAVDPVAEKLGESKESVTRGVEASVASVLGGLITKSKDPSSIRQVFDLFGNRQATPDISADVPGMVARISPGAPTTGPAAEFLAMLFGAKTDTVGEMISRAAGFKNPTSGSSLLGLAAPLVLGFLGRKVRDESLSFGALSTMLVGEKESILSSAPAGLMNAVEPGVTVPSVEDLVRHRPASADLVPPGMRRSNAKWWWTGVAVAALALFWFYATRGRAPTVPGAAVLDTAVTQAGRGVQSAAGEVAATAAGLGAFVKRMLPGGVELNVPERGIESKLIAFITDKSRAVNDTTWFDFDRLNFATGSATILPESQEQVRNIVAVLKAYPNVDVKIGGYTDNVGSPTANLRLSQRRAESVMQALIGDGIPRRRLQAEGYGEQHPVADNATEEGRARNRRIALKVTKK